MPDSEMMLMSWKGIQIIQTIQTTDLNEQCLITERFEKPGQIFEFICYETDWPNLVKFVDDVLEKIKNSPKYNQMTLGISFAFGSAISKTKAKGKKDKNGNQKTLYCYYIVLTYSVEWKPGQSYYRKSNDGISNCLYKHEKYDGLCGEKDIERYIDDGFFNKYGKEPLIVAKWKSIYQSAPKNIRYTDDLHIFGKYCYKNSCFFSLTFPMNYQKISQNNFRIKFYC